MADGYMKIHPDESSTISLSMVADNVYVLVYANLNEESREKIFYSGSMLKGQVIGTESPLSDITLTILVGGNSPDEIENNAAVLRTAFGNANGGYIEYRPPGYSSSIMPTFYKYLRSAPPQQVDPTSVYQSPIASNSIGGLYKFTVKIHAMAMSDPDSLISLISEVDINNYTPNGYVSIADSSIKGDGLIPMIDIGKGSDPDFVDQFMVHIMPIESGAEGDDFLEPAIAMSNFTFDTTARYKITGSSSGYVNYAIPETSRLLFGRVAPIVPCKVSDGEWEVRLSGDMGASTLEALTDWVDVLGNTDTFDFNVLDTIGWPPVSLPVTRPLTSVGVQKLRIEFRTKDAAAHEMYFYGVLMSPVNIGCWIALFVNGGATLDLYNQIRHAIDAIDGSAYLITYDPTQTMVLGFNKQGLPVDSMIIRKGVDHQLRVLLHSTNTSGEGVHHSSPTMKLNVKGLFYTIYPFSEA